MWGWHAEWASFGGQERWWQWKTKLFQMKGEISTASVPGRKTQRLLAHVVDTGLSFYLWFEQFTRLTKTLFNSVCIRKGETSKCLFLMIRTNHEWQRYKRGDCWLSCRWWLYDWYTPAESRSECNCYFKYISSESAQDMKWLLTALITFARWIKTIISGIWTGLCDSDTTKEEFSTVNIQRQGRWRETSVGS